MPESPMRVNEFGQPIGEPLSYSGAKAPQPVTLTGRSCRLEPLTRDHAGCLLTDLQAGAGDEQWTYMPFGPFERVDGPGGYAEGIGALIDAPDVLPFAIVTDAQAGGYHGRVVGTASYLRIAPAGGTIEVGWIMYGAGARRATPATETMYLLARHVFDDLGFRRYEWKCHALNEPSRRAAARLGFAYEGTWRNAAFYKNRNRDTAWFAMTDADWTRLRPGYEAWLAQADEPECRSLREFLDVS